MATLASSIQLTFGFLSSSTVIRVAVVALFRTAIIQGTSQGIVTTSLLLGRSMDNLDTLHFTTYHRLISTIRILHGNA